MQTAKNLWLSREKTFGRKVEELFLSQVLESCLTKDEIMELYLNIVEFGPNVYGLRQAAQHYFKVDPVSLDPREAFYLAWILPRPRKSPPPSAATMTRMSTLMQMLAKQGRLSDAMTLGLDPPDTTGWE
jgi:membrane peptidoglycan carboxypeptidase